MAKLDIEASPDNSILTIRIGKHRIKVRQGLWTQQAVVSIKAKSGTEYTYVIGVGKVASHSWGEGD
jgi:hypothetical protein